MAGKAGLLFAWQALFSTFGEVNTVIYGFVKTLEYFSRNNNAVKSNITVRLDFIGTGHRSIAILYCLDCQ